MKARVKATYYTSAFNEGEIVEIIPNMEADAADVFNVPAGKCFLCKKEDGTLKYIIATNLQLLSSEDDPDYWTKLEYQYAGMAMQSYVSNNVYLREIREMCKEPQEMRDLIADLSILLATTLVQKLKEKEEKK